MLFNCNVSINKNGNMVIEVPTGIKKDMDEKQVYEQLQSLMNTKNAFTKDYSQKDGKINKYMYFSNIKGMNGRYDSIEVGGVEFKIKLDVVLTSNEVEKHKPITQDINKYKQLLEQGLITQEVYDLIMGSMKKAK
ncbi:hypothetical protein [Clostridium sp.]|uniref:hypothetical protein n=1 Tax=Clostridium sp. TaxID=1506 RepID=UPI0025797E26|nr:hypothetical protein [Clostridium sp.]MBE6058215.1 hypothetical protein [Clostridium sp.]